jgi:hypothetical protein
MKLLTLGLLSRLHKTVRVTPAPAVMALLTEPCSDYNTLIEIVPPSQPLYRDASSVVRSLEPRIEFARKRDTDKMLGQLKDVGNSVLGEPED